MAKLSSLSFLIPVYNDHATIDRVIEEAVEIGRQVARKFEIVVIDDGSRKKIRSRLTTVMRHPINQGYGRTIKELYYAGTGEWLFTIPGDYQVGAKELEKLIPYTQHADMILGWRVKRSDPPNRLFVSWVYNTLLRVLFGITLHDINSVRLMRRAILKEIKLSSSSAFVDAELVIRSMRKRLRVIEVPIFHRSRLDGGNGGGVHWRTVAATILDMLRFFL